MSIKSFVKNSWTKAIAFLGWDNQDEVTFGWAGRTSVSAERAKYGAELGNPLTHPLIMAAVQWLMRTIYEAPLQLVKRDASGKVVSRRARHYVIDLLKKPNAYYNGMVMMKGVAASWDIDGNAYIIKWRNPDTLRVEALFYEPHYSIRPRFYGDLIFSGNQILRDDKKFISFYEVYRPNLAGTGGDWKRVEVDDVIHLRDGIDPTNPRKGINKLASLLAELFTDQQRAYFSATVLSNVGMIPFVVSPRETNQVITPKQAEKLKEELELRSREGRGKPIVAGRAIRVDELGFSPEDMDLTAMASIPEERVASVIGPNSYVLGFIPENSVYTNFLEARRDAYESFLIPLQSYIAAQLTDDLLREFIDDENQNLEYYYADVYAMLEWRMKVFELWGKAFRDGISKRSEAKSGTGQEMDDDEEDGYYEDFNSKPDKETLPNPGNPGPNDAGPSRTGTLDGNERASQRQDRGPVAGGKKLSK
jgi:HK97 family phage portal protein